MSEPTGNESVDALLAELDRRIAGGGGPEGPTPESGREWLRKVRPMLHAKAMEDPDEFEEALKDVWHKLGLEL